MLKMEAFNSRLVARLTHMPVKLRNSALKDVKMRGRTGYVYEHKATATKCVETKTALHTKMHQAVRLEHVFKYICAKHFDCGRSSYRFLFSTPCPLTA